MSISRYGKCGELMAVIYRPLDGDNALHRGDTTERLFSFRVRATTQQLRAVIQLDRRREKGIAHHDSYIPEEQESLFL